MQENARVKRAERSSTRFSSDGQRLSRSPSTPPGPVFDSESRGSPPSEVVPLVDENCSPARPMYVLSAGSLVPSPWAVESGLRAALLSPNASLPVSFMLSSRLPEVSIRFPSSSPSSRGSRILPPSLNSVTCAPGEISTKTAIRTPFVIGGFALT